MNSTLFLRLRLENGETLGSCSPEIRDAVATLVRLKAASLCTAEQSAHLSNVFARVSRHSRDAEAGGDEVQEHKTGKKTIQERAQELMRQLQNNAPKHDKDPVFQALIKDYSPMVAATFVSDPAASIRLWRLLYAMLKDGDKQQLQADLEKLRKKFFSEEIARMALGCVIELGDDVNFMQKLLASTWLKSLHADLVRELLELEHKFCESLSGMKLDGHGIGAPQSRVAAVDEAANGENEAKDDRVRF